MGIQVRWVWRGSRTPQTGFHMHHMPLESSLVASAALVAAVASRRLVRHRLREVPDGLGSPPPPPVGPVDPFNCADDYNEWQAGWSVDKKQWCCNIHGRGCPAPGEGYEARPANSYDCNSGFANW